MKTRSAKNKGKRLQNTIRDLILKHYPSLTMDDVKSITMGEKGHDIQLSSAAKAIFPVAVECKNLAKVAVYKFYEQALENSAKDNWDGFLEPVVFVKGNHKEPLMIIDAEFGVYLLSVFFKELEAKGFKHENSSHS